MSPGCDPTSEANESRALEGSFLTPEFRSRNDHLLNFVRSSLAELVDVQLGRFILVLLGRFGDNYWYVWYLHVLTNVTNAALTDAQR